MKNVRKRSKVIVPDRVRILTVGVQSGIFKLYTREFSVTFAVDIRSRSSLSTNQKMATNRYDGDISRRR